MVFSITPTISALTLTAPSADVVGAEEEDEEEEEEEDEDDDEDEEEEEGGVDEEEEEEGGEGFLGMETRRRRLEVTWRSPKTGWQ